MYSVDDLYIENVSRETAKALVIKYHYMRTFPAGALLYFGIFLKSSKVIKGIAVFGKSSGTDSKTKLFGIEPKNIIEMQRLWLSDELGANAESKVLSLIMRSIKANAPDIRVVWTYAGGCKNDCGIVYQSSGFMYLGSEKCEDFWLTAGGEYKNLINALRFGKAPKHLKTREEIGRHLHGPGELIKSQRHYYFYPIDKGIRRRMADKCLPFPKNSAVFRRDQKWITSGAGQGDCGNTLGSNPGGSTNCASSVESGTSAYQAEGDGESPIDALQPKSPS